MLGDDTVQPLFEFEHITNADFHVAGGSLGSAEHLVNHYIGIWKRVTLALGSTTEQHSTHAGGLTDAIGVHIAGHELHRIVNCQTGSYTSPGRIHIKMNILL